LIGIDVPKSLLSRQKEEPIMRNDIVIAVDVAKSVFEVGVSDHPGHICRRERPGRGQFLACLASLLTGGVQIPVVGPPLHRYDISSYQGEAMAKAKLAVTLDSALVSELDDLVSKHRFANRSQAVEMAVAEKLERLAKTRLARECAKLDPDEERALAEEGLAGGQDTWPEY
jgi:Arc/MetJ-type ribon-helix-helix transcriptional regulator